jgi:hypothetical protein
VPNFRGSRVAVAKNIKNFNLGDSNQQSTSTHQNGIPFRTTEKCWNSV